MKKALLVVGWILSLILVFGLTRVYAARSVNTMLSTKLDEIQAELWFDHLKESIQVEDYLVRGCASEATEIFRFRMDMDLELLTKFHHEHPDSSLNKYILDRAPEVLTRIKDFKNSPGRSWMQPKCTKPPRAVQ